MSIKPIFETVEELKENLDNVSIESLTREMEGDDLLLIDIREIQENVDLGTIPGAIHVPRGMLEFWADPRSPYFRDYFEERRRTVLFCAGGGRSALAAVALLDMGFKDVAHFEPGFNGWKAAGGAVEDDAAGRADGVCQRPVGRGEAGGLDDRRRDWRSGLPVDHSK